MSTAEIKKQVEYYLGDDNLSRDKFFHEQITLSTDGFIGVQLFLKCNKIRKLGITEEQLVEAIKTSELIELNEKHTMVRRKENKALPELKLTPQQGQEESHQHHHHQKEAPKKEVDPLVVNVKGNRETPVSFASIQDAISAEFNLGSVYTRFQRGDGHIVFDKNVSDTAAITRLFAEGVKIGDIELQFSEAQGEKLSEFWEQHGDHYKFCVRNKQEKAARDNRKGGNKDNKGKKSKKYFNFNGEKWSNIEQLKNVFKQILVRAKNNEPLSQSHTQLLKELLQYHDKGEEKLSNFKEFTADTHPTYKDTRCFFIVRQDGTKEDFSAVKCIKNLETKLGL